MKNKSSPAKIENPVTVQMTFPGKAKLGQFIKIATKMGLKCRPELIPKIPEEGMHQYQVLGNDIPAVKKLLWEAQRQLGLASVLALQGKANAVFNSLQLAAHFVTAACWLRCEARCEFKKKK